jgi:hypothetical protein
MLAQPFVTDTQWCFRTPDGKMKAYHSREGMVVTHALFVRRSDGTGWFFNGSYAGFEAAQRAAIETDPTWAPGVDYAIVERESF